MSYRQNSVFKILPKRTASFSKYLVDQTSRQNKLSNYSKVINIDGTKSGDIYKLQNPTNLHLKQKAKKPHIQSSFQSKILSFLMVAAKNEYKSSSRKKQSVKNRLENGQKIFKKNKSHSLGACYDESRKNMKMEQIVNVQKKQIIQENSSNCLKNQKLLNIKQEKSAEDYYQSFVRYNNQLFKQSITSRVQKQHSSSPKGKISNLIQDQEGYLTSQIEGTNVGQRQRKQSRFKTEQQKMYELDDQVREYLSLEKAKQMGNQKIKPNSEGVRIFSAMQLFNQYKTAGKIKYNLRGGSLQRHINNKCKQNGLSDNNNFDNHKFRSINDSLKVTNLPKRLPIYSRKKRNIKNNTNNNQQIYFDNFLTSRQPQLM